MGRSNPAGDALQFTIGGCLFGAGVFLFMNQVMVRSPYVPTGLFRSWRGLGGWGNGGMVPLGTPGLGLVMIPLAIGVCLLFAGSFQRWGRLLVWGSLAALFVGVLNAVRFSFMPATLWQLAVYVVMIASGGGLMFRSLRSYSDSDPPPPDPGQRGDDDRDAAARAAVERKELRRQLEELKRRLDDEGR